MPDRSLPKIYPYVYTQQGSGANSDGEAKDDLIEDPWNCDAEYEDGFSP
jgi:hypothetical protein